MSPISDPIARLRDERPDLDPRDPLARPRCTRPADVRSSRRPQRHVMRVAIIAAVACAAIFTGVFTLNTGKSEHRALGISAAEARERAIGALTGVARLRNFTSTQTWSATEIGGDERVSESSWTYVQVDGTTSRTSWNQNDFAGIERRDGLERRAVEGKLYQSRGHTRHIREPWLLDVRGGWTAPGSNTSVTDDHFGFEQPDFAAIVEQLELEGLIDARTTEGGSTIVSIKRPARELAPITASIPIGDPVSMFAGSLTWGKHGDREVTIRITIGADGNLRRIRASATSPMVHADGNGGSDPIESLNVTEQSWTPTTTKVVAPDPADVMVVGNVLKARRGERGLAGPLGTLDTLTLDDLRRLRREVMATPSAAYDGWGRTHRPARPARSYPKLWAQRRAEQAAFRKAVAEMMPFDRSAFASNPDCEPLWPDSRRAMDTATAQSDPDQAGWRCDLGGDVGIVVIMPDPSGIIEWQPPSGGNVGFGDGGYRPRS